MKVWVLTKELNEYDQYGEYFQAVFSEKPHHTQLLECGVPRNRLRHVLNGGGRVKWENEWFFLRKVDAKEAKMKIKTDNFVISNDDLGTVIITDLSDKNYPDKFFLDAGLLDELHHLIGAYLQERGG